MDRGSKSGGKLEGGDVERGIGQVYGTRGGGPIGRGGREREREGASWTEGRGMEYYGWKRL